MENLREWLSNDENRRGITQDQLSVILGELSSRRIGVPGLNKFTITFSWIWNVSMFYVSILLISDDMHDAVMDVIFLNLGHHNGDHLFHYLCSSQTTKVEGIIYGSYHGWD